MVCIVHRRLLVIAAAATLATGCETMRRQDQVVRLDPALTAYAGAVRWGNFDTALAFSRPRSGTPAPVSYGVLSRVKCTGYTIRINRINDAGDEASVSFSFTYYLQDRGTVDRADQDVTWYYSEQSKAWLMDGGLPNFGR